MKVYNYGKQSVSQEDIDSIVSVLKSDYLTQGPKVIEFEQAICEYTTAKYCIAVSSATAALHIAMIAAGIGNGDEVITTPNTFVASVNCVLYVNGKIKFADIDPETANISLNNIENVITDKTKAIIPVHFAGQSCDMEGISLIAKKNAVSIIEDAAHAIGSEYKGSKVGSCKYSDMSIFSFHPVKTITTGEGGAITTNDESIYKKLLLLRSHGLDKNLGIRHENHGNWYYEMQNLGFNYRMTEIQAALGISQLKRLDEFKRKRRHILFTYKKLFGEESRISFLKEEEFSNACFHLCPVLIDFIELGIDKKRFFTDLQNIGLNLQVHYVPVHLHPYYQRFGYKPGDYLKSEEYYERTISLPLYPDLSNEDIECIVERFLKVLRNA